MIQYQMGWTKSNFIQNFNPSNKKLGQVWLATSLNNLYPESMKLKEKEDPVCWMLFIAQNSRTIEIFMIFGVLQKY